jgi:multiple sugar transport system ATP-binding protein
MHDGRIEQIGAPLDLYDRPDNLFVAQFIGSPAMNVVTARCAGATAARSSRPRRHALAAAGWRGRRRPVRRARRAPEHLTLAGGDAARVPARSSWSSRPARRPSCSCRSARAGDARHVGTADVNPGERVGLAVEPGMAHLFDQKTGQRLGRRNHGDHATTKARARRASQNSPRRVAFATRTMSPLMTANPARSRCAPRNGSAVTTVTGSCTARG